jgi:hypothetical protein
VFNFGFGHLAILYTSVSSGKFWRQYTYYQTGNLDYGDSMLSPETWQPKSIPNVCSGQILLKNSIIWMGEFPAENQINLNFTC